MTDIVFETAWRLVEEAGAAAVEPSTSQRSLAARASVSPAGLRHHFAAPGDLGIAMVRQLCERPDPLGAGQVRRGLSATAVEGLVGLARGAAWDNWAIASGEDELLRRSFLHRSVSVASSAGPDAAQLRAILASSQYGEFVPMVAEVCERVLDRAGLELLPPFSYEDAVRVLTSISAGVMLQWQIDPGAVREDLVSDVTVAMMAVLSVPRGQRPEVDDVVTRLPSTVPVDPAVAGERRRSVATAAADAGVFAERFPSAVASVGAAIRNDPLELRGLFGTVDHLVASAFVRHLPALREVARATGSVRETVRALAIGASFDGVVAGALLRLRLSAAPPTLSTEVPLDDLLTDVLAGTAAIPPRRPGVVTGVVDATLCAALTPSLDLDDVSRGLAAALER